MREQQHSQEADVIRLLAQHFEEAPMRDGFRRDLLNQTRRAAAARAPRSLLRRRPGRILVGLAAAACAGLLLVGLHDDGARRAMNALSARFHAPAAAVLPVKKVPASELLVVALATAPVTDGSGRALAVGDHVPAAAEVLTGKGGGVTLLTAGGSEFHLGPNSRFSLDASGAGRITEGRLYCCNRSGEVRRLDTPAGRIGLLGTTLDAAVTRHDTVSVIVVEGKVRLANAHGEAVVPAGRRSILVASLAPGAGVTVNTTAETAWCDGRNEILSGYGQIVYTVTRPPLDQLPAPEWVPALAEVWAMNADGSGKRRVKTYIGWPDAPGSWLPGSQWVQFRTFPALWGPPDTQLRNALVNAGTSIVERQQRWLLNVATGQDVTFQLPPGYEALYPVFSPDCRQVTFTGQYRPDPADRNRSEGGLWLYDLQTGEIRKLLDGWLKTAPTWSPNGRYLVISSGQGYGVNHSLVVIDTLSGEVRRLGIQGAGAAVSPNGSQVAYCGDFKREGERFRGVPTSGSIFLLDVAQDTQPIPLSPQGEGAMEPTWSPDGTRVLYSVQHRKSATLSPEEVTKPDPHEYAIYIAQADGSQISQLYKGDGFPGATAWAPNGEAVYVRADAPGFLSRKVLLIAADGSGRAVDLGGNDADSILSPLEERQTNAAMAAVREAVFQYALGQTLASEGRHPESQAAFQTAASLFRELPWRYPLVRFSVPDTQRYAEAASRAASR